MDHVSYWLEPKRVGALVVLTAMLITQSVGPALAYSSASPGYAGVVSQLPAVYATPPDANVMLTLDDSGSMKDETIPDDSNSIGTTMWNSTWNSSTMLDKFKITSQKWRYYRSSSGNPIYYNPNVRYMPWPYAGDDMQTYPNASPTAACYYPATLPIPTSPLPLPTDTPSLNTCGTNVRNLAARVVVNTPDNASQDDETKGYWPATYFKYTGPGPLYANGQSNQSTGNPNDATGQSYWKKVEIRDGKTFPKVAARTDCSGAEGSSGCSYEEEIQNFANWFQYYRTRALMAKGAVAMAFSRQGTNMRTGFATLHATTIDTTANPDLTTPNLIKRGVRKFEGTDRVAFYANVYATGAGNFTPLRYAADVIGKYFERSNEGNPWSENPANVASVGTEHSCRRSFHILTSDGYWNTNDEGPMTSVGNADNFTGYVAPRKVTATSDSTFANNNTDLLTIDPFKDSVSSTLSDYVAYYWKRDLRTNVANNVKPSSRDPAYWQHLTTFTVGIGVSNGTAAVTTQTQRDTLIANTTAVSWGNPVTGGNLQKGDDFVHASMTGRGRFFLALNPSDFANDLAAALSEVANTPLDLASVAADAPQVRSGGKVYQATFSPSKWYGRLYAFTQDASTGLVNNKPTDPPYTNASQAWEASNKMPAPAARNIFTYSGTAGTDFTWASLSATQQGHLNNDSTLLDYLRGSASGEVANGGSFRNRSRYTVGGVTGGVLGDVVNGSPLKGPDAGGGYDRLPSGDPAKTAYSSFRSGTTLDNMRNTIFLGANDGMLHAFNLDDGVERFAYVPNAVYNVPRSTSGGIAEQKLKMLADPAYTHRFTVDGPPNIADAYLAGAWKSVLIASNGAGARGIFAMDVTNPVVGASATEFRTGKVMWEFTEAHNTDMGFVLSYPHIARMRDGTWAAIFGNGYDSLNGKAKLFILNLQTGAVLKEFVVDTTGNNGLSQPNFILNANREVVAIYAGDLKGKLWKFDVSDTDPLNWNVAFSSTPLFSAVNAAGNVQPITVMPEISAHPSGGAMVTFGTGKLFETSDTLVSNPPNVNLETQSLYGVWDKPSAATGVSGRSLLLAQTASSVSPPTGYGATTSNTPDWTTHRGWYFDLGVGGERVNLSPQQVKSTLFMVANKPLVDPCANGGTARIFALNPLTGGAPSFAVFDTDGSQTFDASEIGINVKLNTTGVLTQPIFQLPSQASYTAPAGVQLTPFALFDRGQASAARGGGVELSMTSGGTLSSSSSSIPNPCALLMTAAQSDTSLMQQFIQTCVNSPGKPRISWRQLK